MTVLKIIRNAQQLPMSAKHVQTKNEVQSGLKALFPCFIAKIHKKTTTTKKKKRENGGLLGGLRKNGISTALHIKIFWPPPPSPGSLLLRPLFKNYWITGVRPVKIKIPLHVTNEISDVTRLHWKPNVYIVDRLLILKQSFNIFEVC